jgi:SAM-dependent methyltransferase
MEELQRPWIILVLALCFLAYLLLVNMDFQDILGPLQKDGKRTGYDGSSLAVPEAAYPWVARLRAAKIAPYVKEDDTVLEYGVRFGWNLASIQCKRRIGFDRSDFFASFVRDHGIEFVSDLSNIGDGSIDVVVCHHQLEHELAPAQVLHSIRRVLRTDGKLLLFVPYEVGNPTRRFGHMDSYQRLYSWNVQTLGNLVQATGFKVMQARIGRFGYDRFSAVWSHRYHLGELGFRVLRRALHLVRPSSEVELVALKK